MVLKIKIKRSTILHTFLLDFEYNTVKSVLDKYWTCHGKEPSIRYESTYFVCPFH